jgi:serine/threonine protein phosphatase PrpC
MDTVKEPGMCSKRLATEAAVRGSRDNITVIVVFLRPLYLQLSEYTDAKFAR